MKKNRNKLAWLTLLCGLSAHAEVFEQTLPNGLKVVVQEDHRAPVVVQQVWYRAGSMDEVTGRTGVAHVLEHMMFKGTARVPAGEFSKRIAAAGGRENAFTSQDYTAYFQQLGRDKLPLAMKLEADRMHNLRLSAEEFGKEIKVVMEERRWRTDDQPQGVLQESLQATAYQQHPYHHPVVGWMSDLQAMTVADARDWYRQWYAPNNATLVVAGDVSAQQVFAWAARYYGRIPRQTLPVRRDWQEPPQKGLKRVVVKAPAQLPQLLLGYQAPTLRDVQRDWLPAALEILAGVLDGHEAARLNQALVRGQKVASNAWAGYDATGRGPGLFLLGATPSEGRSVAEVEAALRQQLTQLMRDGITPAELARAKAQVLAREVYKRDSLFYQAMQIGQMESIGLGWRALAQMLEKLQSVSAEQVQQAAQQILQDDGLTVAVLDPQPLSDKQRPAAGGFHGH